MDNIVISLKNISKSYKMYNSPAEKLKEMFHPFKKKYHMDFWALRDVSFDLKKGESLGIIGRNGSGKSTLLKILCGVLQPTAGEVKVNGRISALLELGAGFNPEFTGRENVFMNGAIMGISAVEMQERFDSIASFADIGEFIDQPVKVYSSGMYVRLAFACAINVEPDILIVDEALSVGDMFFQAKCVTRMKTILEKGVTLIFVSHDTGTIKSVCKKGLLLANGEMIVYGQSDKVVQEYFSSIVKGSQATKNDVKPLPTNSLLQNDVENMGDDAVFSKNADFLKRASFQRVQNGKAEFWNVQLLDELGEELRSVEYEQKVTLRMAIEINEDIPMLAFGYHIRDKNGVDAVYSDSMIENSSLTSVKNGERYLIDWSFKAALREGNYNIACVMSIPVDLVISKVDFCDFVPLAVQFEMRLRKPTKLYGLTHWDNSVKVRNINRLKESKL
ncbi:MAG: ABC transporter ATP-binding protein [Deltaproteobacteria bacterium]|nr:ABC transporter ATP-binding protein [Deltaproteobacteria bacterium]